MDDTKAPATKADILALENRLAERFDRVDEHFETVGERFDKIDERLDNLSERIDSSFNEVFRKLDGGSEERRQLRERIDNHEQRLTAVEKVVGIGA
jgi:DNA anti-recombination protein RmuC